MRIKQVIVRLQICRILWMIIEKISVILMKKINC
eukprot:UN12661